MIKLLKFKEMTGGVSLRLLLGIAVISLLPAILWAKGPQWWTDRGVKASDTAANDYAAVNQGQLKKIATAAVAELDAHLPVGAGNTLHGMVNNWATHPPQANDYAAVNLGQLKTVAKPFYDRLLSAGYRGHPLESGTYPWISGTANDYAMANIGQVKNLFSFELSFPVPTTPSSLSGTAQPSAFHLEWTDNSDNETGFVIERSIDGGKSWTSVGSVAANAASFDDPDGISGAFYVYRVRAVNQIVHSAASNAVSISGTDPETADTDGDGLADAWELRNGLSPLNANDAYENLSGDGYPNIYKCAHGIDLQAGAIPTPDFIVDPNAGENLLTGTFTTISDAVAALTHDYQIILVKPGIYHECIVLDTYKAMIVSQSGPDATVIQVDSNDVDQQLFTSSVDCVLHGFKLRNIPGNLGGGFCFFDKADSGQIVISNSIIENCSQPTKWGAGLFVGANWHAAVKNCIFSRNNAEQGGALYNAQASIDIKNCTFKSNISSAGGRAIYNNAGNIRVSNSIVWGDYVDQIDDASAGVSVSYSDIKGGFSGDGNIDAVPLFVHEGHLTASSPCRGIGNPITSLPLDIDGDSRGATPDIGADHYVPIVNTLPDWWKWKYFHTTEVAPNADADGDDISNLDEARAGADPTSIFNGSTAPSRLTATVASNAVHLEWVDNSDDETGFVIERSADGGLHWTDIQTVEADTTSCGDANGNSGPFYIYRVSAVNTNGRSAPSNSISINASDPETTDSDADGIPDGWELRFGLNPHNSDDAYANPSGDGYPNIYKYAHGIDLQSGAIPAPDIIVDPNAGENPPSGTFLTISSAIAALTKDYQIIQVLPGVYNENIQLRTNKIMLVSKCGPQLTVIRGVVGSKNDVVACESDVVLAGFTVCRNLQDDGGGCGFYDSVSNNNSKRAAIINCIIRNCKQSDYWGGGVWFASSWNASVINCIFRDNGANKGGALGNSGASIKINSCTFVNNRAADVGQAIYTGSGAINISNSIFWSEKNDQIVCDDGQILIDHSDIRGGRAGIQNLNIEPLLAPTGYLTVLSPCRGIADVDSVIRFDIDGKERGDSPDIGAAQFVPILDNLPEWWKVKYFHSTDVDPDADSDGDGISNLEEARGGTDPTDFYNGVLPTITKVDGDNQVAMPDFWLPTPLIVSVSNTDGVVSGAPVRFEVLGDQGVGVASGTDSTTVSSSLVAKTGTDGVARVYVLCPSVSGPDMVVHAIVETDTRKISVSFTAHFAPPSTPTNLCATPMPELCRLEWVDNSDNESGFVIEVSNDKGNTWSVLQTIDANTTTFDHADGRLDYGGFYVYRVRSINGGGRSNPSNLVSNQGTDLNYSYTDSDGDGYPNIYEYLRDSNPYSSGSVPVADFIVDNCGAEGTYQTIQSAIDAAQQDYSIIEVRPGVYNENITVSTHKLLLLSSSGAATTIIDGKAAGSVITVSNDSVFFGFTITNGFADQNGVSGTGGGISIQGGSPRFTNCVITKNEADVGAAVYSRGISPMLMNCTIFANIGGTNSATSQTIANASGNLGVVNSIVWNPALSVELSGTGFNLSYSDVRDCPFNTSPYYSDDPFLTPDGHLSSFSPAALWAPGYQCENSALAPKVDMDGEIRGETPTIGADQYVDKDGNQIPDWWEIKNFGKSGVDPNTYAMCDGLTVLDAYTQGIAIASYYGAETPNITVAGGEGQAVPLGDFVPLPFVISVTGSEGNPLPNAPVSFQSAVGDIGLAPVKGGTYSAMQIVRTGTDGTAKVFMKMPEHRDTALTVTVTPVGNNTASQVSLSISIAPPLPPNIFPSGPYLTARRTVTLTSIAPGASIYYTTDGSEPTTSGSTIQSGGEVMISKDCVLKAKVIDRFSEESATRSQEYTLTGQVLFTEGSEKVYALRTDGSVWSWWQRYDESNHNRWHTAAVQVQGLHDIIQLVSSVCGDEEHFLALSNSGKVYGWTNKVVGVFDLRTVSSDVPVQVMRNASEPLTDVICIANDASEAYAVLKDGTVVYWAGYFSWDAQTPPFPKLIDGLSSIRDIKTSGATGYCFALRDDGTVLGFVVGCLPYTVDGLHDVKGIATGGCTYAMMGDGHVKGWGGDPAANPLGITVYPDKYLIETYDPTTVERPTIIPELTNVIQISRVWGQTTAVSRDGCLWTWGHGYRGDGATYDKGWFNYVEEHTSIKKNPYLNNIVGVSLSSFSGSPSGGIAIAKDGTLWAWGATGLPPTGINLIPVPLSFKVKNWDVNGSTASQGQGDSSGSTGNGTSGGTNNGNSSSGVAGGNGSNPNTSEINVTIQTPENGVTIQ